MKTNSMKQKAPLLSFEFAASNGKITPFTFQNPLKVIVAHTVDEVVPSLERVQEEVEKGNYAAGFLTYESSAAFDSACTIKEGSTMPYLWFGIFSEPQVQSVCSTGTYTVTEWEPSVSMDEYEQSILAIKQAIKLGNTYQTNYTIRLHSQFNGDDVAFFERLKKAQSSNFCAYINTGNHSILSASPELFFHLEGDQITTRPMKGTIKRGKSAAEDEANASELYHSEKNRAENVMIVDLLRNDLGIIAEPGTVKVQKLFEIEQYPTVHQMTSTITARVSEKTKFVEIFKALFPCGSITGAPKISTMNIIADLETAPREVYCGAIGYITPKKEAIFNVPIRTVLIEHNSGKATYGVGGGITWDSTSEGEYQEILAKARLLEENRMEFQLLESLLLENKSYFLIEEHLERLKKSAQYFSFQYNEENVKKNLLAFLSQAEDGLLKVRLLVGKDGTLAIEGQPISKQETEMKVNLADEPIDRNNLFLYHKTTYRDMYVKFQNQKPANVFDVLLWNNDGELTEFTNGNVVLEIDGVCWTPPVKSGLLAGTFRDRLVKTGEIREKTLTLSDLKKCQKIWLINSVRKWVEVQIIAKNTGG
jgi:para-aminobenzoate synthetase / 4-amino-4-deoxychorismate lyase